MKTHPGRHLTEAEYVEWRDDRGIAEWVEGEVIIHLPVSRRHARVTRPLMAVLEHFLCHCPFGEAFSAPFAIRLAGRRREPGSCFVATRHRDRANPTYIDGAPDLIIELVSEASRQRDLVEKLVEYERGGVQEYWTIDPAQRRWSFVAWGQMVATPWFRSPTID